MASGFWDLVGFVLGWKSAGPAAEADVTAAGQVWHAGQVAGAFYVCGAGAGQTFTAGQVAGDVYA